MVAAAVDWWARGLAFAGVAISLLSIVLTFTRGKRKVVAVLSNVSVTRPQDIGEPGRHPLVPIAVLTVTAKGEPVPLTDLSIKLVKPQHLDGFGYHTLSPIASIGNSDPGRTCTVFAGTTQTWAFTLQSDNPPDERRVKVRAVLTRGDRARPIRSPKRMVAINRAADGHPFPLLSQSNSSRVRRIPADLLGDRCPPNHLSDAPLGGDSPTRARTGGASSVEPAHAQPDVATVALLSARTATHSELRG